MRLLQGLSLSVTDSPKISQKLGNAKAGLKHGHKPELCPEGINGTYFMKNEYGVNIGVFKPSDEELDSENNPKQSRNQIGISTLKDSYEGASAENSRQDIRQSVFRSSRKSTSHLTSFINNTASASVMNGVKQGEAAVREVAAYLIDKKLHFYGVPSTTMVKLSCPTGSNDNLPDIEGTDTSVEDDEVWMKDNRDVWFKMGSFQEFVESDGSAEDIGVGVFPVHEVHKIGILDLQIFNTDRHEGNILYKRQPTGSYILTPIDHGLSLPHTMDQAWFCWITWPQSQVPFDEATKRYILENIDADQDTQILKSQLNISDDSLRVMKISVMLLKKCVAAGMTLRDIGLIASPSHCDSTPSDLEKMVMQANTECKPSTPGEVIGDDDCFFDKLAVIMGEFIIKKTICKQGNSTR